MNTESQSQDDSDTSRTPNARILGFKARVPNFTQLGPGASFPTAWQPSTEPIALRSCSHKMAQACFRPLMPKQWASKSGCQILHSRATPWEPLLTGAAVTTGLRQFLKSQMPDQRVPDSTQQGNPQYSHKPQQSQQD